MILDSRSPITIFSIAILVLFLIGQWIIGHSANENKRKNETLQFNESKWDSNKPLHYSYQVTTGCMWVHSYHVEKNRSGLIATPMDTSTVVKPISVSDLFAEVRKAHLTSHTVSVEYHPYFGFPTAIEVDWDKAIIDDECFVQVSDFKVLDSNE